MSTFVLDAHGRLHEWVFARLAAGAAALVVGVAPICAAGQTANYEPPKLLEQGTSTSAIVGKASIIMVVLVKADGKVSSVKVQSSTNVRDNAAAIEIARTSTYRRGTLNAKPVDAYYTFDLKFGGETADTAAAPEIARASELVRAEKYSGAKALLDAYLQQHPGDRAAMMLLGVTDEYRNDAAAATKAFDAAGPIQERYKIVASKAYADAAVDALKAKKTDAALVLADKALALQQNVNTLYIRGTIYGNMQRYPAAIADLEKAKVKATAGNADAPTLNALDASLATSYIFGGQTDKGLALALELKRREPGNSRVDDTLASYYNQQAIIKMQAGKREEAVADLESAAKLLPARAVVLYVQAANVLSQGATPDWKRVKAEADKALAIDGNDAHGNYVAGIALANSGDPKTAIPFLQKAKAHAGTDASLNADIDQALKKLGVSS